MVRKSVFSSCRTQLLAIFCVIFTFNYAFSQNPIVTENALTGNPKSEWDISGAGDLSIQGFGTDISVNKGQTVHFKIDAGAGTAYTIKIYRIGYYAGNGARLIANLGNFTGTAQPDPTENSSTGLVDCGNWTESASWAVPASAVSGLYIARLAKTSNGGASHIAFVVRDDAGNSDMLVKTSDATWQAYNVYGGNSLYTGTTSYPSGHAAKVSYNRPYITRDGGGGGDAMEDWFMNAEFPMIRFLERNGYNISYTTDVDMDRDASVITPAIHKVIISVGHDEYWSLNERNKFENARNAGVHLAFFSGNEVYWKTRWENSNRTLVCYKEGTLGENVCGNKCDPTSAWTGLWRDGAAYDAGKPENALTGQISWSDVTSAITVTGAFRTLRFWRNTAVASLAANGSVTFTAGTLGYEWDYQQYTTNYPNGQIALSNQTVSGLTHKLSLYRHPSGALVFGAGTVQWSWGLDNIHDRGSAAPTVAMQQATVNLFADMGVQPATLMSGLVPAAASTDVTAPACVITSPVNGATINSGTNVTISGTASDVGGVLVGVEVSTDGGATWKAANGTANWTFAWTATGNQTVNIKVRGFDDSGNMSVPGAAGSATNITVTVGSGGGGTPTCPCTIFPASSVPQDPNDTDQQPQEVGVKFRASQSGFITGIRFYKGTLNTGTHIGHLWTSTGTLLSTVNFSNETASGWQEALFPSPVAINANTTYVASYFTSSGYYASDIPYFTSAVVNGNLRALADGEDGPNGVFIFTATGAFPTSTYQSTNYWVDVVYETSVVPDVTAPTINITAPAAGTVSGTINVTANAADNIGVAGVQFLLDGFSLGAEVVTSPYTVSWNTATATNGNHTLTARARDAAGNTTTSAGVVVNVNNVPDTQAPTVSITAPANGATVSGTVNITANAADNVGVLGVQFLLDGVNLGTEGSEILSPPYSTAWVTTGTANGSHTLTARARDAAGNFTISTAVVVTVNNNNLVAAYSFNENTGTTANDYSGNNNTGTLTNGPLWSASGKFGSAVQFDGTNDYVNIADANSLDLTNGMTLEAWVNPSNVTGYKTVVCKDRTTTTYTYTLSANNNASNANNQRPDSRLRIGTANKTVTGTTKLALNTWTHLASTYDGATIRLYVNGVQVSSLAITGNITVSANPLRIGGTTALTGQYFAGLIDEVRVYNRALTPQEIQTDMTTPVGPDLVSPAVNITAPAAGTVTGTINVTANATDNISVAGVQFLLDGNNLGAEDLVAPYLVSWNTTTATNANHTLTARARDAAGNITTSTAVIVNVNNIPDTQAPTVSISAPAAGNISGVVGVSANAADNIGVVGVQFLLNGNNLGAEVLASPYTISWTTTTVTNGTYTLTARARDAAGNTTTSAGVVVIVNNVPDTQAPTVNITSPSAGTVLGTINVTANAGDNIAVTGVQFLLNGANLGAEVLAAPYTISWNTTTVSNGTYSLSARARDAAGNTTTSAVVNVTVNNNTNLIVAMSLNEGTGTAAADISGNNHHGTLVSSPTWGAGKYGQGVTFNGTNSYINIPDHTDFTLNPAQSYTWSTWLKCNSFNEWSTVWSQTVDGNNFFYFYAHTSTDPDGGPVTNGISTYWWTNNGTNKVGVHSTDNALTAGQWSHVTVVYDASQVQNNRFTIYVNGVDVTARTDVSSTGTLATLDPTDVRIGSNQPFGEYLNGSVDEVRFYKRALTPAEVVSDMNTPISNDFVNPTVNLTAPAAGTVTGTISVSANATDNIGVAGVQFLLDGNNLGTEIVTPPYNFSWNTVTTANGNHTLTARARDAAGNTTVSTGVIVTVNNDTQAPTVSITAPAAGNVNGTINVNANAADNVGVVGVQFLLDGNLLGTEDLVSPYSISWITTTITDGNHTLTARARDAAGNTTTSAGVIVTVQNNPPDLTAPTVNMTAPAAGNVNGTITVSANAADNVGVVGVQFLLNGNVLGTEDLTSPYSISWNTTTVINGPYTLTARARDLAGNTTTSAGVVVTVNNAADATPPTVSLTAPAAGSVNGTISVSANASDNIGVVGVQFLINGTNLDVEDLTSPYAISWNTTSVPNGNYTLAARARDAVGNVTTSAAVIVTVNNNTNLILSLNLNEGSGTVATDNSGLSHNGTLTNGPTWGAGKYGQAVILDGTNDYINIPDHNDFTLDPAQSYTWSGWVKNNNFNEWSTFFSQTIDANNFFYIYTHSSSDADGGPVTNGISVYWWTANGTNKVGVHSSNNALVAGQWSYLSVVYDASQVQNNRFTIYVNGTDVTARTDVSSTGTLAIIDPTNVRIASNQPFGEYLNGSVDEFKFYKRKLTSTEILADMGTPIATGIVPTVSPANGSTGIATNTNVNIVFNVAMDPATINSSTIELRNSSNVLIASTITFNAITKTATLTPSAALTYSTTYSGKVKGGAAGVKDLTGATMTTDYNWSFTTTDPPLIAPTEGPGGPILVISTTSNPFSRYTVEILRAEGLNQFDAADISTVTAAALNNYDVVILGEMTVTSLQATMFTNWVNAGGTLIAFKPSSLLNSLFGISAAGGTLSDKYLLVNTSSGPGFGIVGQTIQFHGSANLHTLSGATSLANLYSAASTATSNPAVTTKDVGSNGGKAVAFTYDLAKSIIYTRQGNPAWVGQKRDNDIPPIRSDDLFYPDWVDFNKIAIPQADEQQRLLANIILQSNLHRKPLPRFWYLPRDLKAVVVMTGDDHATNGTPGRFNQYLTLGPNTAQDIADWKAIRGTSYIYPNTPFSDAQAASFQSQGFEIALHPTTDCANFTTASLTNVFTTQLADLADNFPSLTPPVTNRTHCLVWNDWLSEAKVELSKGIRFDVNYYYWPESWMANRPGMFTGSGMPMRFADVDGTMVDVYQATTQMTDETNMNYTTFCNAVLDKAVGAEGYYGVFTTNMHTDVANHDGSNAIIASAQARQVPVIAAYQMLNWLDGRNNSYFGNISWNNNQLSFSITARIGAVNLKAMLPISSATGQLISITMDGNAVTFTTQTIKGIQYAFFPAATGIHNYVATYSGAARIATGPKVTGETVAKEKSKTIETTENLALGTKLYVNVLPNPTMSYANVVITSNDESPVTVTVTNMFGQLVEKHDKVVSTGILRIGQAWKGGTYFAEVVQGSQKKVVKIIKLN